MPDMPKTGPTQGFDAKKLWAEVQANSKAMANCVGPHDFERTGSQTTSTKFRCKKCGGTTHGANVYWYQQGLAHGRKVRGT